MRQGTRRFRIAGTQAAGQPPLSLPGGDTCFEVMTGAILPGGCDCVVPVERISVTGGEVELPADLAIEPGMNVHARGLDAQAGARLLGEGTRLGPPELAVLASAGLPHARVRAEPRIMIVTTGDELIEPGLPIEAWQVRRSNAHAMRAALAMRGFPRTAQDHLPDDPAEMRDRLARHLDTHDVLVLTGGVSMGRFDHVPAVLRELGVTQFLHRIAQRPGQPLWFGVAGRGQAVFGLPGNPVSALVCLLRYVVPALLAASGAAPADPEEIALASRLPGPSAAGVLPAGAHRGAGGTGLGRHAQPHARVGRFRLAARHDRALSSCRRGLRFILRARGPVLSLVNMTDRDLSRNTCPGRVTCGRATGCGRPMHDLRISVMDRCNFRCPYCMPRETFHERVPVPEVGRAARPSRRSLRLARAVRARSA